MSKDLITKIHLSLILSCPSQLLDEYEKEGMPVVYIGDLKRYPKKKTLAWLKNYYFDNYSKIDEYYHYEAQ